MSSKPNAPAAGSPTRPRSVLTAVLVLALLCGCVGAVAGGRSGGTATVLLRFSVLPDPTLGDVLPADDRPDRFLQRQVRTLQDDVAPTVAATLGVPDDRVSVTQLRATDVVEVRSTAVPVATASRLVRAVFDGYREQRAEAVARRTDVVRLGVVRQLEGLAAELRAVGAAPSDVVTRGALTGEYSRLLALDNDLERVRVQGETLAVPVQPTTVEPGPTVLRETLLGGLLGLAAGALLALLLVLALERRALAGAPLAPRGGLRPGLGSAG